MSSIAIIAKGILMLDPLLLAIALSTAYYSIATDSFASFSPVDPLVNVQCASSSAYYSSISDEALQKGPTSLSASHPLSNS